MAFIPLPKGVPQEFAGQYQSQLLANLAQASAAYGAAPRGQGMLAALQNGIQQTVRQPLQYQQLARQRDFQDQRNTRANQLLGIQAGNLEAQRANVLAKFREQQAKKEEEQRLRASAANSGDPYLEEAAKNATYDQLKNLTFQKPDKQSDFMTIQNMMASNDPEERARGQALWENFNQQKRSGAATTTITNDLGAKKKAETISKEGEERKFNYVQGIQDSADAAIANRNLYDQIDFVMATSNAKTGKGREIYNDLRGVLKAAGVSVDDKQLAGEEALSSLYKQAGAKALSDAGGNPSDADLRLYVGGVPGMAKTVPGNALLSKMIRMLGDKGIAKAEYIESQMRPDGSYPNNIRSLGRKWDRENRIFGPDVIKEMEAAKRSEERVDFQPQQSGQLRTGSGKVIDTAQEPPALPGRAVAKEPPREGGGVPVPSKISVITQFRTETALKKYISDHRTDIEDALLKEGVADSLSDEEVKILSENGF